MDSNRNVKIEQNPRQTANILSIVTFFFTYKIFKKGVKNDLQENDIYDILTDYKAKNLGDRLEREWNKQRATDKKPSIIRLLVKCYGRTYLMYGFLQLVMKAFYFVVAPMAMGRLVSYFTPGQTHVSRSDAFFYAAVNIGARFLFFFYWHNYMLLIHQFCLRIRASLCSLIYRKALKLTPKALAEITTGKIITLITKDFESFDLMFIFVNDLWNGVIHTTVVGYLMYQQVGVSALIGLGVIIGIIPLHLIVSKVLSILRLKGSAKTDDRLKVTQEVLSSIKIIKMFNWEKFFDKVIALLRKNEIAVLRIIFCMKALALSIGSLSVDVSFYVCIICYRFFGGSVSAEKAFVVLSCYNMLRYTLTRNIPLGIAEFGEFRTSVKRMTHVMLADEVTPDDGEEAFHNKKAGVRLSKVTVEVNNKNVLEGLSVDFEPGLTTIAGYVGSGKSALLGLILNDLKPSHGSIQVDGRISYAAQEPWLFPGTIRQNILFGQPYNRERYQKVLDVCSLALDLQLLPLGDDTIAGDRGLNLSRGQQARINLARAIYRDCEIYLLDDSFAALDSQVSKRVFDECIKDFLKDKLCILVTHHVQHMQQSDKVIVLNEGKIQNSGSYKELQEEGTMNTTDESQTESTNFEEKIANESEDVDEKSELVTTKKINVFGEKKQEGKVNFDVYKRYFNMGGGFPMLCLVLTILVVSQYTHSYSDILVSKWIDIEEKITYYKKNHTEPDAYQDVYIKRDRTLSIYTIMIIFAAVFSITKAAVFFIFSTRASVRLHKINFKTIVNAPMSFFDTHLTANIINRFSRDLFIVDEVMPHTIFHVLSMSFALFGILYVVCSINLIFIIPTSVITIVLFILRRYYMPTSRSLKRLEGVKRSPVLGHLGASLEGISTIRACKAEGILQDEFDKHQDVYNSVSYMYMTTSTAFAFAMDILCIAYNTVLTSTFLFVDTGALAGRVGLALSQGFRLAGFLEWGMRQWANLENQMTSVERVLEYTTIKPENKKGIDLPNWPSQGRIEYKDVNLTYHGCKDPIFVNINFVVEPKEKIGIVGRTGAGKSSIISTLFRLYEVEGSIKIDGQDIKNIAVETLRSKISIIPQNPVLFSGTIRDNLDPNKECSDIDIWKALEEVSLKEVVPNLQQKIDVGGGNYSAGQRQLICLARAIIRKNKILVLDEATANVDPQTDALIQSTINRKFVDCTVLTIAHKLDTIINSDKVMVINAGKLLEYDSPKALVNNKNSVFYRMVKQAGIVSD